MGARNPTKTDLLEYHFPIRLRLEVPHAHGDPVARTMRRVIGHQAFGQSGRDLYLASLSHATAFVCACPSVSMYGQWPLRVILAFETKQEMLVRDALRRIVGDDGYILARAGQQRADRPSWHLHMRCVWDAVQFMRMPHRAQIVMATWRDRNS